MLLDRLRIRGKLTLLVIIPLLGVAGLAVPVVAERVELARRAAATAEAVRLAGRVGTLIQDLQQERLMSIGYLLGVVDRRDLVQQTASVTDRIADLRGEYGADLPAPVRTAVTGVQDLAGTRSGILGRQTRPDQVMSAFGATHGALIDSLRLGEGVDTATPVGRQIVALDAVLRTDEHISAGAAYMVLVAATRNPAMVTQHAANLAALQVSIDRFAAFATPEQRQLYGLVADAVNSRIGPEFVERVTVDPETPIANLAIERLFPAVSSLSTLGQFVEKKIVTDVVAEAVQEQHAALTTAYVVGGLVVGILVLVVLLGIVIARTVARPLTRLINSADRVARVTEAELVRVADDESEAVTAIRLDPVEVGGRDEIGELARAFDRVQTTAVRLVERQTASRRNVAQMFGHVGRRTQNLVGRQIALIDRLEHQETDPARLQHLYRLDHVSSRLRRNASSLVVLSGSTSGDVHTAPIPLGDVVRLALGEIEDYTRVDVQVRLDASVAPGVIGDLVLALAELMENGTSFSPPHTRVTVSAEFTDRGVRISLVDRGLGMPAERMAEENARFTRRERLDLAPSKVLGLFVVGRLARRHDWRVVLTPTPGGGVTVHLDLDERLLIRVGGGRSGTPVVARASVAAPPAAPAAPPARAVPAPSAAPGSPAPPPIAPTPAARPTSPPTPATPASRPDAVPQVAAATAHPDRAGAVPRSEQLPKRRKARTAPAAHPADPAPVFDPAALSRATQSLESGQPWDAFATRTSAGGGVRTGAPGAKAAPGPAGGAALRQRVPGAQLPDTAGAPPGGSPTPADPAVVRALIEEFESGVRRAQRRPPVTSTRPATAGSADSGPAIPASAAPGAATDTGPSAAGPRRTATVTSAERATSAEPAVDGSPERTAARSGAAATPRKLSRRVPGANLTLPLPGPPTVAAGPGDPDAVRDLINEFETGVARALSEVDPHPRHREGPT